MSGLATATQTRTQLLVPTLVLALSLVALGWVGMRVGIRAPVPSIAWASTGLALAALIYFGIRVWPGIFGGTLFINLAAELDPLISIALAAGLTLGPVAGALLLRQSVDFRASLDRVSDVVLLLFVAGPLAALIGAVVSATAYWIAGDLSGHEVLHSLLIWWRTSFGRVVTMTPFCLLMATGSPRWSDLLKRKEFWVAEALLLATCYFTFSGMATGEFRTLTTPLPLVLVVWAGSRFGTRGAVGVALQTLVFASVATKSGLGPFATDDPATTLSLLWIYAMGVGIMAPLLAAAIAQRDWADSTNARAERDRLLFEQRERIMREMHDGVGGQLVSLLSMVQRGKATPDEITEGLRRALDDMRIMIDSLETSREGLPILLGKLRARLEPVLRRNGLELRWRIEPGADLAAFGPEQSLHCLRIIQEAVTNVIQHARASRVEITICPCPSETSRVSIEVRDDGVGRAHAASTDGRGTRNMIDRARELGADLRFESTSPGLRVLLTVPASRPGN